MFSHVQTQIVAKLNRIFLIMCCCHFIWNIITEDEAGSGGDDKPWNLHDIALNKALFFFDQNILIFFLFLHETILCGYSLEAPHWGTSNEYHNIWFHGEIRKIFTWYHSHLELCTSTNLIATDKALFASKKCWYLSYFSKKTTTYVVGTHWKHLGEALLMSTHHICFCWEIRKILCGYPLLSVAMPIFAHIYYCSR